MKLTKNMISYFFCFTPLFAFADDKDEKLADDPTKVVTKLGVGYKNNYDFDTDNFSLSGSLALDDARKINARINHDATEWQIGGSWLFDIGIVNFHFAENVLENETSKTNYSVGTFVPLSYFGLEPFGMQIFPMAGYTYNKGDYRCDYDQNTFEDCGLDSMPDAGNGYVLESSVSHSAYVGGFALKPLTPTFTWIIFGGGSVGSDNYSGYWAGTGLGATIDERNSLNFYSYYSDNSFGSSNGLGLSFTHEFK